MEEFDGRNPEKPPSLRQSEMQMDAHIIIAGDSNALGFLNSGPAPYNPDKRVQIWHEGQWVYMNPGVNTGTPNQPTSWSSEVQIANRWLADNPTGYLWIVKGAETVRGGTNLANDWDPHTGQWFASTTRAADAAMHNLDATLFAFTHYEAAFVGLGENDAVNHQMATDYLANLTEFNFSARAQWHADELIEYRISDGAGAPADNLAVRQAQWQADLADDHLTTFKTIGMAMKPDLIHYADHVALGNASYDGWML